MKKIIYIVLLILTLPCYGWTTAKFINEPTSKKIETEISTDSTKPTQAINKLDSIDKANNQDVIASGRNITKAIVFLKEGDSAINLTANIRLDHRIFGYSRPDIKSERLLLLSVFTNDVEDNPFGCRLGAYYETSDMDGLTLKYISVTKYFIKAIAIDKSNKSTIIYFEKKWIEFD